jgi:hypothetical protein
MSHAPWLTPSAWDADGAGWCWGANGVGARATVRTKIGRTPCAAYDLHVAAMAVATPQRAGSPAHFHPIKQFVLRVNVGGQLGDGTGDASRSRLMPVEVSQTCPSLCGRVAITRVRAPAPGRCAVGAKATVVTWPMELLPSCRATSSQRSPRSMRLHRCSQRRHRCWPTLQSMAADRAETTRPSLWARCAQSHREVGTVASFFTLGLRVFRVLLAIYKAFHALNAQERYVRFEGRAVCRPTTHDRVPSLTSARSS